MDSATIQKVLRIVGKHAERCALEIEAATFVEPDGDVAAPAVFVACQREPLSGEAVQAAVSRACLLYSA